MDAGVGVGVGMGRISGAWRRYLPYRSLGSEVGFVVGCVGGVGPIGGGIVVGGVVGVTLSDFRWMGEGRRV